MGSSKKHKDKDREHKKKRRHRSRSRSRERKRHRRDNDSTNVLEEGDRHRRDNENDNVYEEGEVQDYEYDESSYPTEIESFDYHHSTSSSNQNAPKQKSIESSNSNEASLSIEETNRIRAKLGLKPLDTASSKPDEEATDSREDIHKPAISLTDAKRAATIKERTERMRDKRKVVEKLGKIKTLGESDSDDDATAWVQKNRKLQKEREMAEKRAKALEEMDQEFGIGNLVEEEFKPKSRGQSYTSKDLKGLKVQHNVDKFKEGQSIILTLEDRDVLDEEGGDTLVNVNIRDDERAEENVEKKKKKPQYNPYDDAEEDEYGTFKPVNVLSKYDEEIDGQKKETFVLGSGGLYDTEEDQRMEMIRKELQQHRQTLSVNYLNQQSEYFTSQEMEEKAQFKKTKRKAKKLRKKAILKADDLLPLGNENDTSNLALRAPQARTKEEVDWFNAAPPEYGFVPDSSDHMSAEPQVIDYAHSHVPKLLIKEEPKEEEDDEDVTLDLDDTDAKDLEGVKIEEDEAELDLENALKKTRHIKLKEKKVNVEKKILEEVQKREPVEEEIHNEADDGNIVLHATSEFCRALGDLPTYGQSGNREEDIDELMDFERELKEERLRKEQEDEANTGWNRVEIDDTPVDIAGEDKAILDDEPVVSQGVGAALELAMKKGYIEKETQKMIRAVKNKKELEAANYSIEDKRYDDLDEKYRKRDRYGAGGSLMDFKEKSSYKPGFKLEYVDDSGRKLNEKEAFRQLSHRFHGKGSGKKKTEKRQKKQEEEQLMKMMSSTDTPLGTLTLLQDKQKTEKTPYVVLTGNKGMTTSTIAKPH